MVFVLSFLFRISSGEVGACYSVDSDHSEGVVVWRSDDGGWPWLEAELEADDEECVDDDGEEVKGVMVTIQTEGREVQKANAKRFLQVLDEPLIRRTRKAV